MKKLTCKLMLISWLLSTGIFAQTTLKCGESGTEDIPTFCYPKEDYNNDIDQAKAQLTADLISGYTCEVDECARPAISTCSPVVTKLPGSLTQGDNAWCFSGTARWKCTDCTRITPDTIIGEPFPPIDHFRADTDISIDPLEEHHIHSAQSANAASIHKVFPNPTSDKVRIQVNTIDAQNSIRLILRNTAGQILQTKAYDHFGKTLYNTQMDITSLSAGMYFLQVEINDQLIGSSKVTKL